ncbi:glycosyltransferase [Candidatus Vampirococcus lugosii]|uniref:Alpha-1,4-N-acetylgalactosamine transferase PglJ n=1 Tax=Candidatus Vampirococcus lugosii TaxID=2789015 RepID=A0ABS5QMV4_9BACT|nr:glycosyltransferase [Candidatus Vampirococcus lugosii]MBS8122304.1 Alpha-1,4-N-acetylgalactosamine transferase PglJ [Candidatus Vampirococcus lugosii]
MEEANFPNILSKYFGSKSKIVISIRTNINKKSGLYKKLIKFLYPKADFITPIVKEGSQNLIQNYGINPKRIQNIYNMFDIKVIQEKSKEDLGDYQELFNNGKYTFINIGKFINAKNQKLLLNAFDKFHQKNPNTQLIILGDGELKEELKNQRKSLSSKEDIYFLGVHENPYKFLANSDAYISSSSWEGMGRVLVEAMACGLSIISTDHPTGAKEIMKKDIQSFEMVDGVSKDKYGILVPVDDEKSLTQAMQDLYDDKDLQGHYSKQSKLRAKDFDVENIINEWENVL